MRMQDAFDLAEEEIRQTWGYGGNDCRYGHLDCSDSHRGRCWNETVGNRAAEILARGAMEQSRKAQTVADQYSDSEAFRGYQS